MPVSTEVPPESPGAAPRPRKLGDAWLDWDPSKPNPQIEWSSGPGPFVFAAALIAALLIGLWVGLLWLAHPRLLSLGLPAPYLIVGVGGGFPIAASPVLLMALWAGVRLPMRLARAMEHVILLLWGPAVFLGGYIGIARDRLAHSFVENANRLSPMSRRARPGDALLILAPRCLNPQTMAQLKARASALHARFVVATGGEEARAAVYHDGRVAVLAIACERDLVAGLREVLTRRAVLGLANRRPEGPCCRSEVDLDACDRHLTTLQRLTAIVD